MSHEHYFSADPAVAFRRTPVTVDVWGRQLQLDSASGVFAQGRLDIGTAVLLREAEPPTAGTILDLGCGYGVIGLSIARVVDNAVVWGIDVNERALKVANDNARALDLERSFRAVLPEEVPAGLAFDAIWSNPPIRIGKEALHALLLTWLPRLAPGGQATMVVGRNLGADSLSAWLGAQGFPTRKVASAKGFRVLETRAG